MNKGYRPAEFNCTKNYDELQEYARTCGFCNTYKNPFFDFRKSTVEVFELTNEKFGKNLCDQVLADNKGDMVYIRKKKSPLSTKLFFLAFVLCFNESLFAGDFDVKGQWRDISRRIIFLTDSGKTDVVFTLYHAKKKLRNKEIQVILNGDTSTVFTNRKGEYNRTFESGAIFGQLIFMYNGEILARFESDKLVREYLIGNPTRVGRFEMNNRYTNRQSGPISFPVRF